MSEASKAHRVFISYFNDKGRDHSIANQVCKVLESEGIKCWIDFRNIIAGNEWREEISNAISQSTIMVLVLSSKCEKSKYIKKEVAFAEDEDVTILPFCIEEVTLKGALKFQLSSCHWINAFDGPIQNHLDRLVNTICSHLGITKKSNIPSSPKEIKEQDDKAKEELPKKKEIPVQEKKTQMSSDKNQIKPPDINIKNEPSEIIENIFKIEGSKVTKGSYKEKKPSKKWIIPTVSLGILLIFLLFVYPGILIQKQPGAASDNKQVSLTDKKADQKEEKPQTEDNKNRTTPKTSKEKTQDKSSKGNSKKETIKKQKNEEAFADPIKKDSPNQNQTNDTSKSDPNSDMPKEVKNIKTKGYKVSKNDQGYWEAEFGDKFVMIFIPAGEFTMGSNRKDDYDNEKPAHPVNLDSYWIGKYEVTFAQYDKFCNAKNKEKPDDENWGRGNRPVIYVSWNDAKAYCDWLSEKYKLTFTLPTEAQWEKAARGRDGLIYPWGNTSLSGDKLNFADKNSDMSWKDDSIDDRHKYTAPVGSYPKGASPFGAMDMAGNVWEWCADRYGDYLKELVTNPRGPNIGSDRLVRGGGWSSTLGFCRASYRRSYGPWVRNLFVGFRLAGSF